MPKVSVIVTTYNRKEFLSETIQSILNQTYKNFELIVVDNFSNYNFFSHIKSFNDSRIRPFQNRNNGIIAINRNYGIAKARGIYLAFCDDDDIWINKKLELQLNKLEETKCDFVSSNTFYFEKKISRIIGRSNNRKIKSVKDFISKNQVNTSSVLVKNKKEVRFPENPTLVSIEDYDLWLSLYIYGYKFEFIKQPLVYYRISGQNKSDENWTEKHFRSIYLYSSIAVKNQDFKIVNLIIKLIGFHWIKLIIKRVLLYLA